MTRRELEEMESRIRNRHPDTLDWRYYMLGLIEEIELLQDRVSVLEMAAAKRENSP